MGSGRDKDRNNVLLDKDTRSRSQLHSMLFSEISFIRSLFANQLRNEGGCMRIESRGGAGGPAIRSAWPKNGLGTWTSTWRRFDIFNSETYQLHNLFGLPLLLSVRDVPQPQLSQHKKEKLRPRGSNPRPTDHQSEVLPTRPFRQCAALGARSIGSLREIT